MPTSTFNVMFFIYFLIYQVFIALHTVILLILRIHGLCLMLKSLCRAH